MQLPSTSKSLAYKIQQLSLLPVLVCILFIGLGFTAIQITQTQELDHRQNELATRWLVTLTQHAISHHNNRQISDTFDDLLEMPNVRGVYLLDAEGRYLLKKGLRPNKLIVDQVTDKPYFWPEKKLFFYSTPIAATETLPNQTPGGWVVVAVHKEEALTQQYQGIALILLGILLASALLMILAWRLSRQIEVPLHNSLKTLQDFSQRQFDSRTPVAGSIELQNLSHGINQLGKSLQQTQSNIRQQIDQATADLQETLETVEIQSIELDIARKKALAASQAKTEFLANTTHEIRTPINGILGFTNLLLKSPLSPQQREYLRTIAHSSQGLLSIINDILDFSRLEEDELMLERGPINLRQIIEESLQILAPSASEKQLYLIATCQPGIPQQLLGDGLRLKQVLINLVSNAIKFSDSGDIVVHTELVSQQGDIAQIKISVIDAGIGIDPSQKDTLFEPFKQADASDSRLRGGTGLGLAIAKGLVEKMSGDIQLLSTPKQGTTVCFTLPLPIQNTTVESRFTELQGKRAAVCFDNKRMLAQLQEYFSLWGMEYVAYEDSRELQQVKDTDIFLIMTTNNQPIEQWLQHLPINSGIPILLAVLPDSSLAYDEQLQLQGINLLFLPLSHDHLYHVLHNSLAASENALPLVSSPMLPQSIKANILVVDDNTANRQLVCTFLQDLGARAIEAESGFQALKAFDSESVDLVFMDVQMPRMDGIETTRQIRAREMASSNPGKRVPIIALTAHNICEQRSKILKAGMDDCISKPVSEEQLIHLINQWLNIEPVYVKEAVCAPVDLDSPANTAAAQLPQSAIMNLQESIRLCNGNKELARDMLSKLNESLAKDVETLYRLFKAQQWSELQEQVHRLHGGCCYCGVPELRAAAAKLDNLLTKGIPDAESTLLHNLLNNLLKAIQRLRQWVDEHDLDIIFDTEPDATKLTSDFPSEDHSS